MTFEDAINQAVKRWKGREVDVSVLVLGGETTARFHAELADAEHHEGGVTLTFAGTGFYLTLDPKDVDSAEWYDAAGDDVPARGLRGGSGRVLRISLGDVAVDLSD